MNIKAIKTIVVVLTLMLLPIQVLAAGTFTHVENDLSMALLKIIVGDVYATNQSTVMAVFFQYFNLLLLNLGFLLIIYYTMTSTVNVALSGRFISQEGGGGKILKVVAGIFLLVARPSGYSNAQVMVYEIIKAGVGLADTTWTEAQNYLNTNSIFIVSTDASSNSSKTITAMDKAEYNKITDVLKEAYISTVCVQLSNSAKVDTAIAPLQQYLKQSDVPPAARSRVNTAIQDMRSLNLKGSNIFFEDASTEINLAATSKDPRPNPNDPTKTRSGNLFQNAKLFTAKYKDNDLSFGYNTSSVLGKECGKIGGIVTPLKGPLTSFVQRIADLDPKDSAGGSSTQLIAAIETAVRAYYATQQSADYTGFSNNATKFGWATAGFYYSPNLYSRAIGADYQKNLRDSASSTSPTAPSAATLTEAGVPAAVKKYLTETSDNSFAGAADTAYKNMKIGSKSKSTGAENPFFKMGNEQYACYEGECGVGDSAEIERTLVAKGESVGGVGGDIISGTGEFVGGAGRTIAKTGKSISTGHKKLTAAFFQMKKTVEFIYEGDTFRLLAAGQDPVRTMAIAGGERMKKSVDILIATFFLVMTQTLATAFCSGKVPMAETIRQTGSLIIAGLFLVSTTAFLSGAIAGILIPMIPILIFTGGVLGWLIAVIEAFMAAPLLAIGLMWPSDGHDIFGRAEPGIMILLNIFFRPTLMVIGLMTGVAISWISIMFLMVAFNASIDNGWINYDALLGWVPIIFIFSALCMAIVIKAFSPIYEFPDRFLVWIGSQSMSWGEHDDLTNAMQRGIESGAGGFGQFMKSLEQEQGRSESMEVGKYAPGSKDNGAKSEEK